MAAPERGVTQRGTHGSPLLDRRDGPAISAGLLAGGRLRHVLRARRASGEDCSSTGFRGEITAQSLDRLRIATVSSEPHAVIRSAEKIRQSYDDDFVVNLAVRGRVMMTQQRFRRRPESRRLRCLRQRPPLPDRLPRSVPADRAEDSAGHVHRTLPAAGRQDGCGGARRSRRGRTVRPLRPLPDHAGGQPARRGGPAARRQRGRTARHRAVRGNRRQRAARHATGRAPAARPALYRRPPGRPGPVTSGGRPGASGIGPLPVPAVPGGRNITSPLDPPAAS